MNYVNKTVAIDANNFVVFNDRSGERRAFHVSEIAKNLFPAVINGKPYDGIVSIHNGDYPEGYPLNVKLDSMTGFPCAVDIVEVVYDEDQARNFMH